MEDMNGEVEISSIVISKLARDTTANDCLSVRVLGILIELIEIVSSSVKSGVTRIETGFQLR